MDRKTWEKNQNGRTECTEKEKSSEREREPGGNELVVVLRGFFIMEEDPGPAVFESYFLGLLLCIE